MATLVTLVDEGTFNLMCDLCAPDVQEKKLLSELVEIVKNRVEPQTSEVAERQIFRERKQNGGETIMEFLQQLN